MPPRGDLYLLPPPPGCDLGCVGFLARVFVVAAARAPRGQYDFVDAIEAGQGLIHSPGHDAQTIARAADKAKDVGYVRAVIRLLMHRMMETYIEKLP
ncbi:hypothetical protein Tco_0677042 [Tanacetum coccineum]